MIMMDMMCEPGDPSSDFPPGQATHVDAGLFGRHQADGSVDEAAAAGAGAEAGGCACFAAFAFFGIGEPAPAAFFFVFANAASSSAFSRLNRSACCLAIASHGSLVSSEICDQVSFSLATTNLDALCSSGMAFITCRRGQ